MVCLEGDDTSLNSTLLIKRFKMQQLIKIQEKLVKGAGGFFHMSQTLFKDLCGWRAGKNPVLKRSVSNHKGFDARGAYPCRFDGHTYPYTTREAP